MNERISLEGISESGMQKQVGKEENREEREERKGEEGGGGEL